MKAVVYTRYGPPEVLSLAEVPTPVPRPGEVLVRVLATSVNRSDWETLRGTPFYARVGGPLRPSRRILGSDIAGRVEAVGGGVTRFRPGDNVFADILDRLGGFAEFVRVPQEYLGALPAGLTHEQAACLPQSGAIALQGIRDNVHSGQRVLINGAGGGTGMYAIQLAKLAGAHVTAVDNAGKLEFMRALGADAVLDYEAVDFTRQGIAYDLILDLVSDRRPADYRRALAPGGRLLVVGGLTRSLLRVALAGAGRRDGKRLRVLAVRSGVHRLSPLIELCRTGAVTTHIDRRFPLAQVPEALRHVGEGRARGKVVITVH